MGKREKRKQLRFLQRQAVWLQKVGFGLQKAATARAKAYDAVDEGVEPESFTLPVDGKEVSIDKLNAAIEQRVEEIRQQMRAIDETL